MVIKQKSNPFIIDQHSSPLFHFEMEAFFSLFLFGVILFLCTVAVFVTLPSNYMGAVCGLCGNYNGKAQDDLIPKNGDKPVSPANFGASWRVAEIPGCVEGCKGVCPDCDITQKVKYEKGDFCGIISDPKGPFRDCHSKVDPAEYFEDCVYDVCLYNGRKDVLCDNLGSYTSACQDAGAKVYSWRTSQFCGKKCIQFKNKKVSIGSVIVRSDRSQEICCTFSDFIHSLVIFLT
uniref:VWFD domain-containing protein n=1 Tax=Acanthochromis polyacanthus TaxID=80966 RepID=A0A3Q1H000_9TELE